MSIRTHAPAGQDRESRFALAASDTAPLRPAPTAFAPTFAGRRYISPDVMGALVVLAIGAVIVALVALTGGGSSTGDVPAAKAPAAPKRATTIPAAAARLAANAKPGESIGTMLVPSVVYEHGLAQGTTPKILSQDSGHDASSAMPGQPGTVVIVARRVQQGFGALATVRAGAKVSLKMPYGTIDYKVGGVMTVPAANQSVLRGGAGGQRLVITAVSAGQRLVVSGVRAR